MKLVWILFGLIMSGMLAYGIWQKSTPANKPFKVVAPQPYSKARSKVGSRKATDVKEDILTKEQGSKKLIYKGNLPSQVLPDSIVAYGIALMGVPYLPAGITCEGFDCSGFVYHIFQKYGVKLPHSSALLAQEGDNISLQNTRKGDLLIFTGTDNADRSPGHVGVVITNPGQPVAFVHASSVGGVKISKVNGTGYEKRFLLAKRVL